MNRARARRRLAAWNRYHARYPDLRVSLGQHCGHKWFMRMHTGRSYSSSLRATEQFDAYLERVNADMAQVLARHTDTEAGLRQAKGLPC